MSDATIDLPDGRVLGYADFAPDAPNAVLWCHGGPGSRLEAKAFAAAAGEQGLRIIGIDRPGYGLSTPRPGRSIEACVPDIVAVAEHLGIDQFHIVGVSTGGAYALATAAIEPTRVRGVVACCALTDMREADARASMTGDGAIANIWNSTTRDEALDFAREQFGDDGTKMLDAAGPTGLAEADMAMFTDPAFMAGMMESLPPMFTFGVEGYADDRLADGPGWGGFDVKAVRCPVVVMHGTADTICPPINAETTAKLVPNARLQWFEGDGHFSVVRHVADVLVGMLAG
jgi:pimeloyl-ACP methyl ester carboxylesterase